MFTSKENFITEYKAAFVKNMARPFEDCGEIEQYTMLVDLVGEKLAEKRTETRSKILANGQKKVFYFSLEFLIGRLLDNYLLNLGCRDMVVEALTDLGVDYEAICEIERDPGLGNGGLGRLAACFIDSMASLGIAGTGMGIRYRFGLFAQKIENGRQVETPDAWLVNGYPWEIKKPEGITTVHFGGSVERHFENGKFTFTNHHAETVLAVPYDVPILGGDGETVNMLRLWKSEPVEEVLDLAAFNRGEYANAMKHRSDVDALSCILYPDDSYREGKILRLKQEYFFVSAGLQSILKDFKNEYGTNWAKFPECIAVHINDTHPTLCVPELMRLLMDEEGLDWDEAWAITTKTISYTNHTILPEALEKWSIGLFKELLPRVYMIVEEIDRRYRESFDHSLENWQYLWQKTAILWDGQVHMANLSIIGSYAVNGVAALHTEILKADVVKEFYTLTPEKFNNKTNGISHRRFIMEANPKLTALISETIGDGWKKDPELLKELLKFEDDSEFLGKIMDVKVENKKRLAAYIEKTMGIEIDENSVFDIQVKRIHAYKRQLLNVFKIMALYNRLKSNPDLDIVPHTFIFAGKAAQSYIFAKEVIRLIVAVADIVNNDAEIAGKIKVVFIENFNVSKAQLIYPAADISEQISTAGKEASGTGNMKFMFNGALTLGTLDGANIEIKENAGDDNVCIFGMTADEVMSLHQSGYYNASWEMNNNPEIKLVMEQLVNGFFGKDVPEFWEIYDNLMNTNDEYFVFKDFEAYMAAWFSLNELHKNGNAWAKKALYNIANAGHFTSDRTIKEYADEIWHCEYNK